MSCLFNSYAPYFKQPFGAVRAGQSVHLTLCIPEELGFVDPHLVIQKEGKNAHDDAPDATTGVAEQFTRKGGVSVW